MKKLPTLFRREFQNHHIIRIMPELSRPELGCVLAGEGVATEKIDGACCAFIDGQFYKRYDAKKNKRGVMKTPPAGAIPLRCAGSCHRALAALGAGGAGFSGGSLVHCGSGEYAGRFDGRNV